MKFLCCVLPCNAIPWVFYHWQVRESISRFLLLEIATEKRAESWFGSLTGLPRAQSLDSSIIYTYLASTHEFKKEK